MISTISSRVGIRADRECKTMSPSLTPPVQDTLYICLKVSAAIARVWAKAQDNNFTDFNGS